MTMRRTKILFAKSRSAGFAGSFEDDKRTHSAESLDLNKIPLQIFRLGFAGECCGGADYSQGSTACKGQAIYLFSI